MPCFYCETESGTFHDVVIAELPEEDRVRVAAGVSIINVCEPCANERYSYCDECIEYFNSDNETRPENGSCVCSSCLDNHYTKCFSCIDWYRNDDLNDGDGNSYCQTCFDEEYNTCCCCDTYTYNDDTRWGHDDPFCVDCFNEHYDYCDGCGDTVHRDDSYYIEGEEISVCGTCYDSNYFRCENCDESWHNDYRHSIHTTSTPSSPPQETGVCGHCYNEREEPCSEAPDVALPVDPHPPIFNPFATLEAPYDDSRTTAMNAGVSISTAQQINTAQTNQEGAIMPDTEAVVEEESDTCKCDMCKYGEDRYFKRMNGELFKPSLHDIKKLAAKLKSTEDEVLSTIKRKTDYSLTHGMMSTLATAIGKVVTPVKLYGMGNGTYDLIVFNVDDRAVSNKEKLDNFLIKSKLSIDFRQSTTNQDERILVSLSARKSKFDNCSEFIGLLCNHKFNKQSSEV